MTRKEIEALSGRALDVAIASRVLEWDTRQVGGMFYRANRGRPEELPEFHKDRAAVLAVEDAIAGKESWVQDSYVEALVPGELDVWKGLRATPEQRCRAALLAVIDSPDLTSPDEEE